MELWKIKFYMLLIVFELIGFILFLFGYRGIRILGFMIGTVAFDIFQYKKRIILYNLDVVYGDSLTKHQKIKLGRRSIINYATAILETLASKRIFKRAKIKIVNEVEARKIQSYSKGIYIVGIHMGNIELTCHFFKKIFIGTNLVANVNKGIAEKIIQFLRSHYIHNINKMNKIEKGLYATRQIFNAIDKKEMVGIAIDHKRPRAESVLFFGRQTPTNNSLARIYLKKNAPIFPVILKRIKPGYFEIKFFDEFVYYRDHNLSLKENITQMTTKLNRIAEKMIMECPEEYWWWRNRWGI